MERPPRFVVFDCNIFVQALLNPMGSAGKCFDLAREGRIVLFVSAATLNEVRTVFQRPHILLRLPRLHSDQIEAFLSEIIYISQLVENVPARYRFDRDPKDQIILDLAIECSAEYIFSWDKDLLDLMTGFDQVSKEFRQRYRSLKIISPADFLKNFTEQSLSLKP
jgi:uncharacterized protein